MDRTGIAKDAILDLEGQIDGSMASLDALAEAGTRPAGTGRRNQTITTAYKRRLGAVVEKVAEAQEGSKRAQLWLREALTIPDFPQIFGDVIDRQLLAKYRQITPTYRDWVDISTVADFRTVKRFTMDGAEAVLPVVKEGDEYPEVKMFDGIYSYAVQKRGRRIPFSWETYINDDLQALQDIPQRFANAAARSEEYFATSLLCDVNGPNAALFSAGNHNLVAAASVAGYVMAGVDNPRLSIVGLQDAYAILSQQRDREGEPIEIDGVILVVPPTLEVVAQNILHATEVRINPVGGAGTASQELVTVNWMKQRTRLVVDYMIPRVVAGAAAFTSWYLIADPKNSRPAFQMGFLRGHGEPEMFMKAPNAVRVGAGTGMVNPEEGDFDSDSLHYKVRHVYGGAIMEPRAAVASTGANA